MELSTFQDPNQASTRLNTNGTVAAGLNHQYANPFAPYILSLSVQLIWPKNL